MAAAGRARRWGQSYGFSLGEGMRPLFRSRSSPAKDSPNQLIGQDRFPSTIGCSLWRKVSVGGAVRVIGPQAHREISRPEDGCAVDLDTRRRDPSFWPQHLHPLAPPHRMHQLEAGHPRWLVEKAHPRMLPR